MISIQYKSLLVILCISTGMSWTHMYLFNTYLFDFSDVIPYWKIPVVYVLEGIVFSIVFEGLLKVKRFSSSGVATNLILSSITLLSIVFPILATVHVDNNEFFPIYAIPLHFIFTLVYISVYSSNSVTNKK